MDARVQQIVLRFVLGTLIVELPILTAVLSQPNPDWKLLGIGLLGGLSAAIEKYLAPVIFPGGLTQTVAVPLRSLPSTPVVTPASSDSAVLGSLRAADPFRQQSGPNLPAGRS